MAPRHLRSYIPRISVYSLRLPELVAPRVSPLSVPRLPRPEHAFNPPSHHFLVHQDPAPRNLIVEARGGLWVVDWGHAGLYPPYGGMEAIEHVMAWLSGST